MKSNSDTTRLFRHALTMTIFCLSGVIISAQTKADDKLKNKDFCTQNNYSYNDKISHKESREIKIPAGNLVNVNGQRNGSIRVRGENRSDVLIRACVQTVGSTEEAARAAAKNIRIETGSEIRAEGAGDTTNWAVSYEIIVPRLSNLKISTENGGIGISSVEGTVEFEAVNGGVSLSDLAGDVKGTTKNGGLSVELIGASWRGRGLDVETTNGGVKLSIPENYAAQIETGTVNGGFKSEISQLNVEKTEKTRGGRINTNLNGGGAPIRVVTTNGGVKISSLLSKTL